LVCCINILVKYKTNRYIDKRTELAYEYLTNLNKNKKQQQQQTNKKQKQANNPKL